ncbi:PilZ domain-containing protein [bacterium]|nr:PilZ domain-containing protein [bacterium]
MTTDWTEHYELDTDNRRRAPRINRHFAVQCMDDHESIERGSALNVSSTGARLVLKRPCRGEFTLQLDENTQVLARTVWSHQLSGYAVVGVEFDLRAAEQRRSVASFLARLAA